MRVERNGKKSMWNREPIEMEGRREKKKERKNEEE